MVPGHGISTTEMGTPEQMRQEQETRQKNLKKLLGVGGVLFLPGLLNSVEHTVNEGGGILATVSFGYFNCFVDGNLGRDIFLKHQLIDRYPEQVSVRGSDSLQPPIGGMGNDGAINLVEFFENTAEKIPGIGTSLFVDLI